MGVYAGALGRDDVRRYVESSDCLIMLGAFMTDVNLGIYTAQLDPARSIYATSEKLSIRYHNYENVRFKDFVRGLLRAKFRRRQWPRFPRLEKTDGTARPPLKRVKQIASQRSALARGGIPLTVKALFQRLNSF